MSNFWRCVCEDFHNCWHALHTKYHCGSPHTHGLPNPSLEDSTVLSGLATIGCLMYLHQVQPRPIPFHYTSISSYRTGRNIKIKHWV